MQEAQELCVKLQKILCAEKPTYGKIINIKQKVCTIETSSGFVYKIIGSEEEAGLYSIRLSRGEDFTKLGLKEGKRIVALPDRILAENSRLYVVLKDSKVKSFSLKPLGPVSKGDLKLQMLEYFLMSRSNLYTFGALIEALGEEHQALGINIYRTTPRDLKYRMLKPLFVQSFSCLLKERGEAFGRNLTTLLDNGGSLTPALLDFFCTLILDIKAEEQIAGRSLLNISYEEIIGPLRAVLDVESLQDLKGAFNLEGAQGTLELLEAYHYSTLEEFNEVMKVHWLKSSNAINRLLGIYLGEKIVMCKK